MIRPELRVRYIIVVSAGLLIWIVIATSSANRWLIGLAPVFLAVWLLFCSYQGYLLLRVRRWRKRQEEEKNALANLAIPPDVMKPEAFEGVQAIDNVKKRVLPHPPDYQGRFRALGITVALAPPLALLFLSLQTLFFPSGDPWAPGLVLAEALLLSWLIWTVWITPDPTGQWLTTRLRAELLRREKYLCLAAVGPYLRSPSESTVRAQSNRLAILESGELHQLRQLTPLATLRSVVDPTMGDQSWIDEFWQSANILLRLPTALERMNCYLHFRISKQKAWFALGKQVNHGIENRISQALKAAVLMAFAAATIHAALLFEHVEHQNALPVLMHLLAFTLPPFSSALIALQCLFASRTLADVYKDAHDKLVRQETNLRSIVNRFQTAANDNERQRAEVAFQSLVLQTEHILVQEMETWLFLNGRIEYEVAT